MTAILLLGTSGPLSAFQMLWRPAHSSSGGVWWTCGLQFLAILKHREQIQESVLNEVWEPSVQMLFGVLVQLQEFEDEGKALGSLFIQRHS